MPWGADIVPVGPKQLRGVACVFVALFLQLPWKKAQAPCSGGAGIRLCLRGTAAPTVLPTSLGLSHGGVGRARVISA